MRLTELYVVFIMLYGLVSALKCASPTPASMISELEKELFPKKMLRPVEFFWQTSNVTMTIVVLEILGVNDKVQAVTTFLAQRLSWNIEGLSWNKSECGTAAVAVPLEHVWAPDIYIEEFMDEDLSPQSLRVHVSNTGRVSVTNLLRVVSSCQLTIYTFPFDYQNCSLTFRSSIYVDSEIRLIQGLTAEQSLGYSLRMIKTSGEWSLVHLYSKQSTLVIPVGNYSVVTYHLLIKRSPLLYVVNLLIPSCFLITVDLFGFLLPPQSVDRSSFKMTLILGYTVFLLIMNDLLPITGETTPLINVFFSISLALMIISLLETILITNIQFSSTGYSEVPIWLKILVLEYLALLVCLPPEKKSNRVTVTLHQNCRDVRINTGNGGTPTQDSNSSPALKPEKPSEDPQHMMLMELKRLSKDLLTIRMHVDKHFKGTSESHEWHKIGIVMDRLFFGVYISFISSSFITIIGIWIFSNIAEP